MANPANTIRPPQETPLLDSRRPGFASPAWALFFSVLVAQMFANGAAVPEYDPGQTYAQGQLVTLGDQLYVSLQPGNSGNDPATSPTWWLPSSLWVPAGSDIQYPGGNVGIGGDPTEALDVQSGAVSVKGAATTPVARQGVVDYAADTTRVTSRGPDPATHGAIELKTTTSDNSSERTVIVIDPDGRVGVGGEPDWNLESIGDNDYGIAAATTYRTGDPAGVLMMRGAHGTQAAPLPLLNGDCFARLQCWGYPGTAGFNGVSAGFEALATENWTNTNQGSKLQFHITPAGGTAIFYPLILTEDGVEITGLVSAVEMRLQTGGYALRVYYGATLSNLIATRFAGYAFLQSQTDALSYDPLALNPAGGNVWVGAAADDGSGALLQVNGAVKATAFIGAGIGGAPTQYSSFAGTITGSIDGENEVFTLSSSPASALVLYVDSARLVVGLHFTWTPGSPTITFLLGYIPQPGAVIAAEGW